MLASEYERLCSDANLIAPAAGWLVLAGNAVLSSSWNARRGSKVRRPRTRLVQQAAQEAAAYCPRYGYEEPAIAARERCPECGGPLLAEEDYQGQLGPRMRPLLDAYGQPVMGSHEEPESDEHGRPVYDEYWRGDIEEPVVHLLNWYPQPARSFDKVRYVVETEPMDLDELKDLFGSQARRESAEALDVEEWHTAFAPSATETGILRERRDQRDKVLLKILRHIPDHRFPKGLLLIGTREQLYPKGDLDTPDGELGYTHLKYREIPGTFWGLGPLADILPQQKRVNAIDSSIVQNRKQMISHQWLVPEGAGVSHVDGRSGLIIRWSPHTTGGFKPERLPGVPLPPQVMEERTATLGDMRELTGITEVMQGRRPQGASGLETGAAVEYLYESAYKRFKAPIIRWRAGLAHRFHRNLKLAATHWTEPRLVRVLGANKDLEAYHYQASDLRRAQDMTVRVGMGRQSSSVAHQRKALEAAKMGLLGDLADPSVRGRILETLEIEGFETEYVADARKAKRVLKALREGLEAPPLLPADNHAIQYQVLREFTLTCEFEQLDPQYQQAAMQRAMAHLQQMQAAQQQAIAAAQAAKGAGLGATAGLAQAGMTGAVPTQQVGA